MEKKTNDEAMATLRERFRRFASGCTESEAQHVFAVIEKGWSMQPDYLPKVLAMLEAEVGLGPNALITWLYSTVLVAHSTSGRKMLQRSPG